ncbi:hypothetical protein [Moumouvirus maliensis]|nr:hypothetical protein [Moumouvirus maliensis]
MVQYISYYYQLIIIININMDMCIDGIHGIVSHILGKNSNLTSIQVRDAIKKLNPDLINDRIFKNIYPNIYGIVFCEIKLGLYKPRLGLKHHNNLNNYDDYNSCMDLNNEIIEYNFTDHLLQLDNNIDDFWLHITTQEKYKKNEYHKKCQNRITQKMINQRMATKQKQQTTKFRKY